MSWARPSTLAHPTSRAGIAGKDRTGAAAALLLALTRAEKEYIAHDFALTRIGVEAARALLTMKLTGGKAVDEQNESQGRRMDLYGDPR